MVTILSEPLGQKKKLAVPLMCNAQTPALAVHQNDITLPLLLFPAFFYCYSICSYLWSHVSTFLAEAVSSMSSIL